jgi:hypothetical protein
VVPSLLTAAPAIANPCPDITPQPLEYIITKGWTNVRPFVPPRRALIANLVQIDG